MDNNDHRVVRQCGLMEHFSTSRHAVGFNRGIALSCKYKVRNEGLEGRSGRTVVEEALARLIVRLGGLRVGITGEDTNRACFVRVPSMNLQDFIQWTTSAARSPDEADDVVLRVIKSRLEQLWPDVANRPPWQALIVEHADPASDVIELDIIFAVHHALADGKSTIVFHTELLRELNGPSGCPPELEVHVLTFTNDPVLAPSQEELVDIQISWPFFLKTLWSEFGPFWLKPIPPPQPWTGKVISLEPQKLNCRVVTIAPDTVPRLVAVCRSHGTTLSGILHALALASFARNVSADVASSFSSQTPISLLPWAKLPAGVKMDLSRVLTDVVTGTKRLWDAATVARIRTAFLEADASSEETVIWPLAATWRREIKAKAATLPNDDGVGMLRYITDFNKRWLDKLGKNRDATWEVSNIGSVRGHTPNDEDGWSISRSLFMQPINVASEAVSINVAGVDGGPVSLVLSWQDTIVNEMIVDGIAKDLQTWFDEFGKKQTFGIFTRA